MRKSLESRVVMVPSKSEKKMNLGLVFMAGRVEGAILKGVAVCSVGLLEFNVGEVKSPF